MLGDRRCLHEHPCVLRHGPPAHERHAPIRRERSDDVGERCVGVVEEHDPEATRRHVERTIQRGDLGVGRDESRVFQPPLGRACVRVGQHRLREIDARGRSVGAGTDRGLERQGAVAAADVEDASPRTDVGDVQGPDPERLEHLVVAARLVGPLSGLVAVPVLALVCVRLGHGANLGRHVPLASEPLVHSL